MAWGPAAGEIAHLERHDGTAELVVERDHALVLAPPPRVVGDETVADLVVVTCELFDAHAREP